MTSQHSFIVLGAGGEFTYNVIQTLIKKNYKPLAYIQSGRIRKKTSFENIELEILKPQGNLTQLIKLENIPFYYQSQIEITKFIKQLNVEYLLVACWPQLIPNKVLQSVSKAALNLHPSLLPDFRGIDPVGDQLKQKNNNFGISLHLINEIYDSGDIVLQKKLRIKKNIDKINIETRAARKGAELFIQAIKTYEKPGWQLVRQDVND